MKDVLKIVLALILFQFLIAPLVAFIMNMLIMVILQRFQSNNVPPDIGFKKADIVCYDDSEIASVRMLYE